MDRDISLIIRQIQVFRPCASVLVCRLAKESDISRSMIYEEITAGRLIARKVGRRTVVRRSDALRWLRLLPPLDPTESNGATTEKTEPAS